MKNPNQQQCVVLICAAFISKGCDENDVVEVAYSALQNNLNIFDELYKAFY